MRTNPVRVERIQRILNHRWFAVVVPAVVGLGLAAFIVLVVKDYGWSLFLGLPLVVSFLSAYCFSFRREISFGTAYGAVVQSVLLLGGEILVVAMDGAVCLFIALPLSAMGK